MMNFSEFLAEQEPNTLYVSRPVSIGDAKKIAAWASTQGFNKTLRPADMHVTIAFSTTPVDWNKWRKDLTNLTIEPGGRSVVPLGDKGAVVLKIQSNYLDNRWQNFIDGGASWDHESYSPHITITYDGADTDLSNVTPYDNRIELTGEQWAEVKLDWDKNIKEV